MNTTREKWRIEREGNAPDDPIEQGYRAVENNVGAVRVGVAIVQILTLVLLVTATAIGVKLLLRTWQWILAP